MRSASFEEHLLSPKIGSPAPDREGGREERRAPFWTISGRLISFIVIFFVLNIFVYLRIGHIVESNTELAEPPVRPPYTVLGEIYKYTDVRPSKYGFLVNAPILATQVSRAEPDKVFSVDTHKWLGDFGTLSPPDRHLHVTSTLHTILQFYIHDWGMEKCTFTARLPTRDGVSPHEYEINDIRGTVRLEICELDAVGLLNPIHLTWKKRPKCIKYLGTIDARVGEEVQLESFPCQAGAFRTFEVACAPDMANCGVNVWSDNNDTWGLYLTQH